MAEQEQKARRPDGRARVVREKGHPTTLPLCPFVRRGTADPRPLDLALCIPRELRCSSSQSPSK